MRTLISGPKAWTGWVALCLLAATAGCGPGHSGSSSTRGDGASRSESGPAGKTAPTTRVQHDPG